MPTAQVQWLSPHGHTGFGFSPTDTLNIRLTVLKSLRLKGKTNGFHYSSFRNAFFHPEVPKKVFSRGIGIEKRKKNCWIKLSYVFLLEIILEIHTCRFKCVRALWGALACQFRAELWRLGGEDAPALRSYLNSLSTAWVDGTSVPGGFLLRTSRWLPSLM